MTDARGQWPAGTQLCPSCRLETQTPGEAGGCGVIPTLGVVKGLAEFP